MLHSETSYAFLGISRDMNTICMYEEKYMNKNYFSAQSSPVPSSQNISNMFSPSKNFKERGEGYNKYWGRGHNNTRF